MSPLGEDSSLLGTQLLHDLQIATQALLNAIENIEEDLAEETEVRKDWRWLAQNVEKLKLRTLELSTSLQSLQSGEYLGDYRFSLCPLVFLVHSSVQTFQEQARRRDISLDASGVKHLMVWVSEEHAKLLLNNVIQNAIKYSYGGGDGRARTVKISASQQRGVFARLVISNYGVGILAEEMYRLFTPGFRGAMARAEGRTGTGMGLFTAQKIAKDMGGDLQITSRQVGEGETAPYLTEAIVDLPCGRTK